MSEVIDLRQATPASERVVRYRRLISSVDQDGRSFFVQDGECPNTQTIMGIADFATTELWKTHAAPVLLAAEDADPSAGPVTLSPSPAGTTFRIVQFPPDSMIAEHQDQRRPEDLMHRTPSIDYAYVIEGEVYAVLDKEERLMRAGDVLVQRGTNHNWSNRSDKPCRVLFVLVGAALSAG